MAVNGTGRREAVMPQDIMVGAIRSEMRSPSARGNVMIAAGAVQIDARGASAGDAAAIERAVQNALRHLAREWEERS